MLSKSPSTSPKAPMPDKKEGNFPLKDPKFLLKEESFLLKERTPTLLEGHTPSKKEILSQRRKSLLLKNHILTQKEPKCSLFIPNPPKTASSPVIKAKKLLLREPLFPLKERTPTLLEGMTL